MDELKIYGRLLTYLRPYWRQVILAYGATLSVTLLNLFVPQIIAEAIDRGVLDESGRALVIAGLLILVIALVRGVGAFVQRYYGLWLTHTFAYDLRNTFYDAVQFAPFSFHDQAHTGDLMSRAISDTGETEQFVGVGLMELLSTLLLIVGVVFFMLWEDARLAAIALLPIAVLAVVTIRFGRTVQPMFKRVQEQMGALSTTMQEGLTGIALVKAFAREPHEFEKFDRDNAEWLARRQRVIRTWGNNWPLFLFLVMFGVFLLLWFGGPMAIEGVITVGGLFAMISYMLMLNAPMQRLGWLVNQAATTGASARRVFEIIDVQDDAPEPAAPVIPERIEGKVEFRDVSFTYRGNRAALHKVCFVAQPGQSIALIGPTGSGKSTVINLLPRFYDPKEGAVLIDDMDVRTLQLQALRRQIGIVLQNPFLFSTTIAENIAYGRRDASNEEIAAAAVAARAHDFIVSFPNGYATRVGERGVTLSGGQKQRIAIARALLTDPRILILDDSTSSVDTETEHLIQLALTDLMKGRTTFVIAQRLLTLKSADCILVLDHGEIVERGSHRELLALDGLYRQIYDLQLRDQEEFLTSGRSSPGSAP
jgi:ATP-binding cassette subfamily B protein